MFSINKNKTNDDIAASSDVPNIDMSKFVEIHNRGGRHFKTDDNHQAVLVLNRNGMRLSPLAAEKIGLKSSDKKVSLNLSYSAVYRAFHVEPSGDMEVGYHFYKNSARNQADRYGAIVRTDTPRGVSKHKPTIGVYESLPDNPNIFIFKESK